MATLRRETERESSLQALPHWSAACNPSRLKLKNDISQQWFIALAVKNDKERTVFLCRLVFHKRLLSNHNLVFSSSKDTVRLPSISTLGRKALCCLLAGYVMHFKDSQHLHHQQLSDKVRIWLWSFSWQPWTEIHKTFKLPLTTLEQDVPVSKWDLHHVKEVILYIYVLCSSAATIQEKNNCFWSPRNSF